MSDFDLEEPEFEENAEANPRISHNIKNKLKRDPSFGFGS